MIAIIDYGVGNIFSLSRSLRTVGAEVTVTGCADEIRKADTLILPGVGAFEDAIALLRRDGLAEVVAEEAKNGKPLLGICLGMQLLFDESLEYGRHKGLGLIHGRMESIRGVVPAECKVPHIGWNSLRFTNGRPVSPLFKYIKEGDFVYFVHSYYGTECEESTIAVTDYGAELTAAVQHDNVCGFQFHPEKSGKVGLKLLKAFCEGAGEC